MAEMHRLVVGATPDVMVAARSAAAGIVRDFYADAIRKGRCDSDEIVLAAARAILAERERCARVMEERASDLRAAASVCPTVEQRVTINKDAEMIEVIAVAIRRGDTP